MKIVDDDFHQVISVTQEQVTGYSVLLSGVILRYGSKPVIKMNFILLAGLKLRPTEHATYC